MNAILYAMRAIVVIHGTIAYCLTLLPIAYWYCLPDPPAGGYGIEPPPTSESQTAY
ncbi:MAG: hypothetical protein KBB24_04560 [Bacteroidales bacterium]|nr:hypothetical protein [Bacteroidales bacterium]MDX9927056.1 hypothetical protein [Bacteroidales bacterium]HNX83042.1 hypothetical protein [Bacteroidales bacterium]HPS97261.1 hypothetical protein [Bacteroidales bacterium]